MRDSERVGDDSEECAATFDDMKVLEKGEIMERRAADLERQKRETYEMIDLMYSQSPSQRDEVQSRLARSRVTWNGGLFGARICDIGRGNLGNLRVIGHRP